MSVCSGKAYKPQLCRLQFTISPAYYLMYLIWQIVHVARIKIVLFQVVFDNPLPSTCQCLHIGVVYKVLAYSHRSTVVPIIGYSVN